MNRPRHIFIDEEAAVLRSYSAGSSKAGKTTLKLELEITDPYALGDILRQLAAFNTPAPAPARPKRQPQLRLMPPGGLD